MIRPRAGMENDMAEENKGFFSKLKDGLKKTRSSITDNMDQVFNTYGYEKVSEDFLDELEETMIMGDIGVQTTEDLLDDLRQKVKDERIKYCPDCRQELILGIRNKMKQPPYAYDFEKGPAVVLVTGVNGVGKTTTVGKLAYKYKSEGKRVLIASADTFRAAANEQLTEWANRAGVDIIGGSEGADPAAVVYNSTTCLYSAAQFAVWMGFSEIILLGVDHRFRVSRTNNGEIYVDPTVRDYFTEKYNPDADKLDVPNLEKSTTAFEAMKKACDARGIRVLNATRGGALEVFPRVEFDALICGECGG